MKICTVVGARPQFIKCAAVSMEMRKFAQEVLIHTGQHYDANMSDVFFADLELPQPDYHLGVGSGGHGVQTGAMLSSLESVLCTERPQCVVVYGDTNSTLAGALAAVKLHIPVAHVEAGLRSYNRAMPEEINRIVADHISSKLFCPTQTAMDNLRKEGIDRGVIFSGDVMYDAVLRFAAIAGGRSDVLRRMGVESKGYLLATLHRASNTDDKDNLYAILDGLRALNEVVVIPIHPRTRQKMKSFDLDLHATDWGAVRFVEPVGYLDMLMLEKNARLILTDSGGVQKESFFFGVPCITLRAETEWVETVNCGWNVIVGANKDKIVKTVHCHSWPKTEPPSLFGDGNAAAKIVNVIIGEAS